MIRKNSRNMPPNDLRLFNITFTFKSRYINHGANPTPIINVDVNKWRKN